MSDLLTTMRELVIANRILAREGVVDAYGHISVRHPTNPERYLISCSRSPELVTLSDIMEFTLDGVAIDPRDRSPYAERYIHGALFEKRTDVHSVIHNHSHAVIPFGVTAVPLRPLVHVAASIGDKVPVWDIRDKFGDTNLLVVNMAQGRDLAEFVGGGRTALMRGHGCVVTGATIKEAVITAVYMQVNARLQMEAMRLGNVIYLSPGEIQEHQKVIFGPLSLNRAWEYFVMRAGCQGM
ncbi:MAG: class II aldolase/adducin family protein [Alphaproteobacteria bacterium]|nr:class II aldolase/adducin family protein [Alphaproteobacteria bacterium]